jgi:DNA-binding transcriptional ArsR family regulator
MLKMIKELTEKEQEALLLIYKDVRTYYNANSLSKELDISQVGAMKLLKRLEDNEILISRKIGKSIVYKLNLKEEIVEKLIGFALINESRKYLRWRDEFKDLYKKGRIVIFYGSASRDYSNAKDVDVMVILDKKDIREVNKKLEERQKLLPKKLHSLKAIKEDLIKNIKENNKAMIEIIKTGIVLYGYDEYMEVINGFTGF